MNFYCHLMNRSNLEEKEGGGIFNKEMKPSEKIKCGKILVLVIVSL